MYRYYLTQRPLSPGTFPGKPVNLHSLTDYGRVMVPEISRPAYAFVEYKSPLSDQEVTNYELVPAFTVFEVGELDERFRARFEEMNPGYSCTGETLNAFFPSGEYAKFVVFRQVGEAVGEAPAVVDRGDYYCYNDGETVQMVNKKTLLADEEI